MTASDRLRNGGQPDLADQVDAEIRAAYAEGRKDEREHIHATMAGARETLSRAIEQADRQALEPDCPYCEGSGEREMTDYSNGPDTVTELVNCPWCKGTGNDLATKCCAGERGPFVKQKCVTCPYVAKAAA